MPSQMCEQARASNMEPVTFACDAHPGFIGMLEWTHTQPVSDLLHRRRESLGGELDPSHQRSL